LSVAVGRRIHMVNEDDDTDAIVTMGETGATIQRVPG
jgi:succinyl-CoA synthetase alpha subunit